jgi:hypothetical protein
MDFVVDHAIALSAIFLGVVVLVALVIMVVRGLALLRAARRAQGRVAEHVAVLTTEAERAQAGMERVTQGQEDLTRELDRLGARLAVAKVLSHNLSEAVAVLRAPLKYLGR